MAGGCVFSTPVPLHPVTVPGVPGGLHTGAGRVPSPCFLEELVHHHHHREVPVEAEGLMWHFWICCLSAALTCIPTVP